MNIMNFQMPEQIVMHKADDFEGVFEFKPLESGFGQTVGNSLRRVLLSSLEGYAISAVRIGGVDHEFSTITGVTQDVIDMILNLKQVRIRPTDPEADIASEQIYLTISGKEEFTAGDITANSSPVRGHEPGTAHLPDGDLGQPRDRTHGIPRAAATSPPARPSPRIASSGSSPWTPSTRRSRR